MPLKPDKLLIDTNILILLLIGEWDRELIGSKRTEKFTIEDYEVLIKLIGKYKKVVFTPHLITEITNLTDSFVNRGFFEFLSVFLKSELFVEEFETWVSLFESKAFVKFGLADSAIYRLSHDCMILTDDMKLYGYISTQTKNCINFEHIRSKYLLKNRK